MVAERDLCWTRGKNSVVRGVFLDNTPSLAEWRMVMASWLISHVMYLVMDATDAV